ncbi:MAG TPA: hypothetical protein P5201_13370, partial [Aminobacteriaceae bacterium]|nr:hypothetical protein [Aminobacteriaceae bacterium]
MKKMLAALLVLLLVVSVASTALAYALDKGTAFENSVMLGKGNGGGNGGGGGGNGGSSGGASGEKPCPWRVVVADDFAFTVYHPITGEPQHSTTGRWLGRWCDGQGGIFGFFLRPEGDLVDPYQLALDALASVRIAPPDIRTSPSERGRLYVQVPTWLWIDRSWWQPYEATANAGRVSSTVRATPVATNWR